MPGLLRLLSTKIILQLRFVVSGYLCCDHLSRPLWVRILVSKAQHHLVSRHMSAIMGKILKLLKREGRKEEKQGEQKALQ